MKFRILKYDFFCATDIILVVSEIIEVKAITKCSLSDGFIDFISQFANPLNALKTLFYCIFSLKNPIYSTDIPVE